MMDSAGRRCKPSLKESERPKKMLKVDAEAEKDEEISLLKERVTELETSLGKRKKEIEKEKSKIKDERKKVFIS